MRNKPIKPRVPSTVDETPARNAVHNRISPHPSHNGSSATSDDFGLSPSPNGRSLVQKDNSEHSPSHVAKAKHAPPSKSPRKKGFVPQQLRDKFAEAGDILALFRSITACDLDVLMNQQWEFGRLYRIIRERAKADPAACGEEALKYSIALLSYLGLRAGNQIERVIRRNDNGRRCPDVAAVPIEVEKELLPSFLTIQRSLAELLHLQAATERQRELTIGKRLENQEAAARLRLSNRTKVNGFGHLIDPAIDAELAETVMDPEAEIELACSGGDFLTMPKLLHGDPADDRLYE